MPRPFLNTLLAVFTFLSLFTRAEAGEYEERMQFANGLHSRGMHDLAVAEFAEIIRTHPDGARNDAAKFRMAESLRLLGRSDEAARLYGKITVEFRKSAFRLRAAYRRARLYMDAGDYEAAAEHFKAVIAAKPPDDIAAASCYYLGETLLMLEKAGKADAAFGDVIGNYPDSMLREFAFLKRGDIYRDRWIAEAPAGGEEAEDLASGALEAYAGAVARKSTERVTAEALFQIAEIHFTRKEFEKSAEFYRRLLKEFPDDQRSAEASLQAAWAAYNAGFYAEALSLANTATEEADADNMPEWLYLKANCRRQLLRNDKAVEIYAKLLELYPDSRFSAASRYERALAYYKEEDYENAAREAELISTEPGIRTDVYWLLAESYSALKRAPEAIQYYRKIVKETPGTDLARDAGYRLAHHLQQRGAFVEASRFYNAIVTEFPEHESAPRALFASGTCLASAGVHNKAVRDWARLIKEWGGSPLVEESLYHKAISEIRLARTEDALGSLSELIRRFPASRFAGDARYWRGMLFKETDRFEDAEKELRVAMKSVAREELRRDATFNLGLVLQKNEKGGEAAELFQRLLDSPLKGKFPPALLEWLTTQHYDQQHYLKAADAARLLAKTAAEDVWQQAALCLLGRALMAVGDAPGAEDAFRRSLSINATTVYGAEAALRLGEMLLDRGDKKEAEAQLKRAARMASADASDGIRARAFFALGKCAERAADMQEASRYYMSVAILYDDENLVPQALSKAVVAFKKMGKTAESEKALEELRERYPNAGSDLESSL